MAGGLTGTGAYVFYTDRSRSSDMMIKYATGNILPPMSEHMYETVYFQRPELEKVCLPQTTGLHDNNSTIKNCFNEKN